MFAVILPAQDMCNTGDRTIYMSTDVMPCIAADKSSVLALVQACAGL